MECPKFTYFDASVGACKLAEVIRVKNSQIRIQIGDLRKEIKESCLQEISKCSGNFLGPFKDKDQGIFAFSFDLPYSFDDKFFSYISFEDKLTGSIVWLKNTNNANSSAIKEAVVIGGAIQNVLVIDSSFSKSGVLIEYYTVKDISGTINKSHIFMQCTKRKSNLMPYLASQWDSNFLFVWETEYACSQCLVKDLKAFVTKCIDSNANMIFDDENNCSIYEKNEEFREEIAEQNLADKKEIISILNRIGVTRNELIVSKVDAADNLEFVWNYTEATFCMFTDNFEHVAWWLVIAVPLLVLLSLIICFWCCCKYTQLRSHYVRIKDGVREIAQTT